jgi:hypothetical protein
MRKPAAVLLAAALLCAAGCVERKMTVTSTPPGARVYLDDVEKGETPVTFRFDFYGDRTFTLVKDGYQVKKEVRKVKEPIYDWPFLDAAADLGPIPLKDHQSFQFTLEPIKEVPTDELIDRAQQMKSRVTGEPVPKKAPVPAGKPEVPKGAGNPPEKPAGTPPPGPASPPAEAPAPGGSAAPAPATE